LFTWENQSSVLLNTAAFNFFQNLVPRISKEITWIDNYSAVENLEEAAFYKCTSGNFKITSAILYYSTRTDWNGSGVLFK
jgi:hypothetical protein